MTTSRLLHHFVYRKVSLKTTWKCRLLILMFVVLFAFLTRVFWIPWIGRSLVCREDVAPSDAILVENFDPDYRVFERAAALQKAGFSGRILIPTEASEHDPEVADTISRGITELMSPYGEAREYQGASWLSHRCYARFPESALVPHLSCCADACRRPDPLHARCRRARRRELGGHVAWDRRRHRAARQA